MTETPTRPESKTPSGWPRVGTVRFVEVPERRCLMIDGEGEPGGPGFQEAIGGLFGTAYTLKFALKREGIQTNVGYLEGLWSRLGTAAGVPLTEPVGDPSAWRWTLFMDLPEAATDADVTAAIETAWAKHPTMAMGRLRIERWREGAVVEAMHIGPYSTEPETIGRMLAAAEAAGLHPTGPHHEIYVGDPNRADPLKLRTVLRQPVG
jgi:hypothetical protein